MELNDVFLVDKFRFRTNEFIKNRSAIETEWIAKTSKKSAFFRGVVSLVGVSNCIKAIAKRHLITNVLIQRKVSKCHYICPRNRAFLIISGQVLHVDGLART